MLFDDKAWERLESAALAIRTAVEITQKIKQKQPAPEIAGTIGMLQQLLQQAADDLQTVISRRAVHEAIFPNAGMMLAAIDKLPADRDVGFKFRRDGQGRYFLSIWTGGG
jgi:hypothetical protein